MELSEPATGAAKGRGRRPVLFLVDVEPDERKTRAGGDGWSGTRDALRLLARLRDELAAATGEPVVLNWFLRVDPQIRDTWGRADLVAERFPELFREIERHGDACGVHPHLWRFDARRQGWYNELTSPEWTAECLGVACEAFARIFGRRPLACRFGDRWLDEHAVAAMRAAGVRYDLTVEPGLPDEALADDPHATARLPDYRAAPREPWQPARGDFLRRRRGASDPDGLWMIPLTTSRPVWRPVRRPPYLLRASRSPNLVLRSWPFLARELERETAAPLVFVLRSGDLAAPAFAARALANAAALVRHPALGRCAFVDPARAVAATPAP